MYRHLFRFLSALLLLFLICSTVQATNLQITVLDSLDKTVISQATVYREGSVLGRTTSSGTFLLTHPGDEDLVLKIKKSGYIDWEGIVDKDDKSVVVNLTRDTVVLKVRLYDSDSLMPVANAEVRLTVDNATEMKKTDSNGFTSFGVNANTIYDVAISAQNYQPQTGRTVEIGTTDKEVQYWLMRFDRFSFVVTSGTNLPVEGAEIYLDSVLKGKTDSRGILTLQITRGNSYVIEVKKDGYQEYKERRTIGADDAVVGIDISKVPIGAFVSVYDENRSPVEGVAVYLDDAVAGYTDKYGKYVLGTITPGAYKLEIRKQGYVTVRQAITISKQGDEFTIAIPFDQADLSVLVLDKDQKVIPGVRVLVNGDDCGLSSENGQVSAKVKFNTALNITASKEGYQRSVIRHSVIIGNATSSVIVPMEKAPDWGFIGLVIIGALVVLLLFALIRHRSRKAGRHIVRKNEI